MALKVHIEQVMESLEMTIYVIDELPNGYLDVWEPVTLKSRRIKRDEFPKIEPMMTLPPWEGDAFIKAIVECANKKGIRPESDSKLGG